MAIVGAATVILWATLTVTAQNSEPAIPAQDSSERIGNWFREGFELLSEERVEEYASQVRRVLRLVPQEAQERMLRRIKFWVQASTIHLMASDRFRSASERNPELLPLVVPKEFYLRSYEMAVSIMLTECTTASAPRPDGATTNAILSQLDQAARHAKAEIAKRISGAGARDLISDTVDEIIRELELNMSNPISGLVRPLNRKEWNQLLERISTKAGELEAKIDKYDKGAVQGVVNLLYLFTDFNYPESGALQQELNLIFDEAVEWRQEAEKLHADRIKSIQDEDAFERAMRNEIFTPPEGVQGGSPQPNEQNPTEDIPRESDHGTQAQRGARAEAATDDSSYLWLLWLILVPPLIGVGVVIYSRVRAAG